MKPLKGVPLTKEEEVEICKNCGGYCCKYFFINPGPEGANIAFHKFRGRGSIIYGKVESIIITDKCPYSNDELGFCEKYDDPNYPKICKEFPIKYRPFWNLKCKLMRVKYARGLIPKDKVAFAKLLTHSGVKKQPFKFFK